MRTPTYSVAFGLAVGIAAFLNSPLVCAQVFEFADARTVQTAGQNALVDRLFLAPGITAPVSTHLWFVADPDGDGVGSVATYSSANDQFTLGDDDVILRRDAVAGSLIGSFSGQFQRNNIQYDASFGGGRIYALLFNTTTPVANWDSFIGTADLKYGVAELTVSQPGGIGNFRWDLVQDIVSNVNSVTVVPEVSTFGWVAALGLAGFGWFRLGRRGSKSE